MRSKTALFVLLMLGVTTPPRAMMAQSVFHGPVSEGPYHWAYVAVIDLMDKGILEGYPDGYFRGRRPLTRDEFAVAMNRFMSQLPIIKAKERTEKERESRLLKLAPNLYKSLPKEHWAYPAMLELKRAGLFRRYDIQGFQGNSEWSRHSIATLLRENRQSLMQPFVDNQRLLTPRVEELLAKLEQEFRVEIAAMDQIK